MTENLEPFSNMPEKTRDLKTILGKKFIMRFERSFFTHSLHILIHKYEVGSNNQYSKKLLDDPNIIVYSIGGIMELSSEALKTINDETKESLKLLKKSFNDIKITSDMLSPELSEMIQKIRTTRMTISSELKQSLSIMKDVRKFFLESDYEKEMERLERFIKLGNELKELIDNGTMNAISDVAIKLSKWE